MSTLTMPNMADVAFQVRTVALGGTPLSQAMQRGTLDVPHMMVRPASVAAWVQRTKEIANAAREHDWFTPLAPAFAATGAAAERLSRAARGGAVVTTGQQPGLFGGPGYTWSKALSALAFADALERESGIPVAPVFWAATDDADWHEAAHTFVVGSRGLETLSLEGPPTDGVPLSKVPLGALDAVMASLGRASGSAANARLLEQIARSYVPQATIGDAYVGLLRAVLEPLGIAVLDASHAALRRAAHPVLQRALTSADKVDAMLRANAQAIGSAGFTPQVELMADLSLVFQTERTSANEVRQRIGLRDAARAAREAEVGTLGPNVLLRPVLERALLPTVAYHAGPGEIAYFAQVGSVANALELANPVAVPRWSGEVVDVAAMRALERLGVDEAMLATPHEAELRIARAALDEESADSVERLRIAVETQVRALRDAVSRDSLLHDTVAEGLQRDLQHRIDRFERRMLAAVKRRESSQISDLAVARAALRPMGHSPERVLNLMPMLVRFGDDLLRQMRENAAVHAEYLLDGAPALT